MQFCGMHTHSGRITPLQLGFGGFLRRLLALANLDCFLGIDLEPLQPLLPQLKGRPDLAFIFAGLHT